MEQRPDSEIKAEIHEQARKDADASVYTLGNVFTTTEEKLEIERWYQLPSEVAAYTFLVGLFYYASGFLTGLYLYILANGAGILAAAFCWFAYSRVLVGALFSLLANRIISWGAHLGVAFWFISQSRPWLGGFALLSLFTGGIPFAIGATFFYQIVTRRYRMHPKYAFLKHFYARSYPFESNVC